MIYNEGDVLLKEGEDPYKEPVLEEVPVFFIDSDGALVARHTVYKELFQENPGATYVVPPDDQRDKTAFFDRETQTWTLKTDYRGQPVYNQETTEVEFVEYVGELKYPHTMEFPSVVSAKK